MKTVPTSVRTLFDKKLALQLGLTLAAGEEGLSNMIENPHPQKLGLALAGYLDGILDNRIQIIGFSEVNFLRTLPPAEAEARFQAVCRRSIAAFILSRSQDPPPFLVQACTKARIPLFRSSATSNRLFDSLYAFLRYYLAPKEAHHATLMDIFGLGVLIRGTSGIGKSECSLELISRGHKLVADDYVILRLEADNTVIGTSGKDWVCGIMQVKGIGIINVNNIFGITSWEKEKQVHLAIELVEPADLRASQEISMARQYLACLGTPLPLIRMPVHKGRNIALIIEVAVKNHILATLGHDDQQLFLQRQEAMLLEKRHEPA